MSNLKIALLMITCLATSSFALQEGVYKTFEQFKISTVTALDSFSLKKSELNVNAERDYYKLFVYDKSRGRDSEWGLFRNGKLWGVVIDSSLYVNYEGYLSQVIYNETMGCFYGAIGSVDVEGSGDVSYYDILVYVDLETGKFKSVTKRLIKKILSKSDEYSKRYTDVKRDRSAREALLKEYIQREKK